MTLSRRDVFVLAQGTHQVTNTKFVFLFAKENCNWDRPPLFRFCNMSPSVILLHQNVLPTTIEATVTVTQVSLSTQNLQNLWLLS